jgi:hypothetical protein
VKLENGGEKIPTRKNGVWGSRRSRSLHYAAGARVRERRKKPAAPVGMTMGVVAIRYVGAKAPPPKIQEGTHLASGAKAHLVCA